MASGRTHPAARSMRLTNMLFRAAVVLLLSTFVLPAAVRLYMKDGTYHMVREYEKKSDRVRFYSTERGDWEEIPLELVDLKRTESEIASREADRKEEAKLMDAEDAADRALREEIARIPYEAGVFLVQGGNVITLDFAESKMVSNRRRSILKAITPIPMVTGKATVEVDGLHAALKVESNRPEFYIRMAADERFGIAKLTATKTSRIVQKWEIVPVTKDIVETTEMIDTFKQQLADGLYKLWPTKPLEAGEYAVIQYTEGKGNIQIWDFSIAR